MSYPNYYYTPSDSEFFFDEERTKINRLQLRDSLINNSKSIGTGFAVGILISASPAWADNIEPVKQNKKELARRLSNVIGCGAITLVCAKASPGKAVELVAQEATKSGNLPFLAAFACGATVAWCAKYAVFDK
jgi:hypothetical protein